MKNFPTLILTFISFISFSQTVQPAKESLRVRGVAADGYEVKLPGTVQEVKDQFEKFLKPLGKTKKSEDADVISLPLVKGKNYTSPIYFTVRDKGTGAAWIGIRADEWTSNKEEISKELERLAHDFGVEFHKAKIQLDIDEANRALQAVERQKQRLENVNKDLNTRLGDNKNEKLQLEKALENNKTQFESLTKKIDVNRKQQDSVSLANDQIKKVIEAHKEKQRKVN